MDRVRGVIRDGVANVDGSRNPQPPREMGR